MAANGQDDLLSQFSAEDMALVGRILAQVKMLAQQDRADGVLDLEMNPAGEYPDGTIVRTPDGNVGFLQRDRDGRLMVCVTDRAVDVAADYPVTVILTPIQLATHFVYSQPMQQACWYSMLTFKAAASVAGKLQGEEYADEAVTYELDGADMTRQALYRASRGITA